MYVRRGGTRDKMREDARRCEKRRGERPFERVIRVGEDEKTKRRRVFVGVQERTLSEEDRRRRRERGGWWSKKQKSSRSWSGPGWSQAIRDHPESRGVQLGSRQSGAVGMRPSEEKNKTNFYALPSPYPSLPIVPSSLLFGFLVRLCSSF